jgi:hexosaminidase
MKKIVIAISFLLIGYIASAQNAVSIIPEPQFLKVNAGSFTFYKNTGFIAPASWKPIAKYLQQITSTSISTLTKGNTRIVFKENQSLAPSEYTLDISANTITILANDYAGALYGAQTIVQLWYTTKTPSRIACISVKDKPRFDYRGLMLDVSRNFYPVSFIKSLIDVLSIYKINNLHLHLTDGAGWRIEIKKYPLLTKQAAFRTHKTWKEWWKNGMGYLQEGDPLAYGGYYTQNDAKEIVAYAAAKAINVIPEIEMPGHSDEVLAAYPNLACDSVTSRSGEFCIGNDSTFIFMQDVLTEIMQLFPSKYIHIGGDEAAKGHWKKCTKCQKRITDNGLKDEDELQSYAIKRMEKFISNKGRYLLGWDEILEGGLAPGARVMSWRGEQGGIDAARQNHDVIMTPGGTCYFDKYQQNPAGEPEAIGGFLPLQKVYEYEPLPATLEKEKQQYIKGAQANLWTEYVPTQEHAAYMIFPRIIALSEVVWSNPKAKNWAQFQEKLAAHYNLLQAYNINYCRPSNRVDIVSSIDTSLQNATISFSSEQFKPTIYYTLDGSNPQASSAVYTTPFTVDGKATIKAAILNAKKSAPDSVLINFHKAFNKPVTYNIPFSKSYPAAGAKTFVNGYRGSLTYQDGQWQGFTSNIDVVIDLQKIDTISLVQANFMQIIGPGVYMPKYIEVQTSVDGINYTNQGRDNNTTSPTESSLLFKDFKVKIKPTAARYVKFISKLQNGFQFIDEIIVE